jgi:Tfp pilus assembly protein FimT
MSATGDRGFTLVETLVIVAIVALISGLSFPSIDHMIDGAAFTSARSGIAAAAGEARARAIREDRPVAFTLPADLPRAARVDLAPSAIIWFADGTASGGAIALDFKSRHAALRIAPETGLIVWMR